MVPVTVGLVLFRQRLVTFLDVGLVDAASQMVSLLIWTASHDSTGLPTLTLLFFEGLLATVFTVLLPLQSRAVEMVESSASAVLSVGEWLLSLFRGIEIVTSCVTAAPKWPRRGSLWEGVEAWLVSVSSVSCAEDGEELQGDDGQQESQEQLV